MKASDLLVEALVSEGVEVVFGLPGEENLDLVESLRRSKIRLVVTRHEQAAGFMAATWGRLTGKAGVCLSTLGPGATNLVTAAAYAQLGAMPMLMLTGQKPIKTPKQGAFQIVDVVAMMRPLTKSSRSLVAADSIPARVREAFRRAEEERPGAVHLELPEDVAREESAARPIAPSASRRPVADDESITRAVTAIRAAKRPLLMIGAGANRKRTAQMLRGLVDGARLPFFSTQMGKGVVDETHPLWLGTASTTTGDHVHHTIAAADCIINCGHDVVEKPPFIMRADQTVIHLNFSPAEVDPVYAPQIEVVGDIANAVGRIASSLDSPGASEMWFTKVNAAHKSEPSSLLQIVGAVRRTLPDGGVVCLDNGMYKLWFARHFPARRPNELLLDNALATMGAGLPSAIAAKVLAPSRPAIAVCGDGGLMMSVAELETAVRLKLDLTIVVLRDDGFGMIRWKQDELGFADHGMTFQNPDFVALAGAFGAHGLRANPDELESALAACLARPGVHVIDVPIDYATSPFAMETES